MSVVEGSLDGLPEDLRLRLMPFQAEGVLFGIGKEGRCLIADEMGLGKTIQALALAYCFRSEWPMLIIVPSSLCYPWVEEVEKWFPDVLPENVNVIETGSDVGKISSSLITIVTYGLLRHSGSRLVHEALLNQKFQVIIVDESHYIKNRRAASTKYIVPLVQNANRRILLTGTPALNRPEELFAQLDAICPGTFGGWTQFAKRYCDAKFKFLGRQRLWVTDGASNLEELQSLLSDRVMVRRLKKNVLTQLPEKRRQRITFKLKESDVKKELERLWEELEKVLRHNRTTIDQAFVNVGTGALSAPSSSVYKLLSELYMKTCEAKIGPVREYIRFLCDTEHLKFIVFSYHRSMTDAIVEQLIESKVKFIRIDGSTPVSDRPHLVSQFQSDEDTRVAVLSIKAAGVGLTLTAASLVVFSELDWTPGTLEQCEDRAHRIGQKSAVDVHYLVAAGTLDEWVWTTLSRKTTVVAAVLNGEKRYLRMNKGTTEQVRCLTDADAYVPTENSKSEFTSLLQTQISGQKTVLDYFSSQKNDSYSETVSLFPALSASSDPYSSSDVVLSNSYIQESSPNPSTSTPVSKNKCIIIESDEDEMFEKDLSWSKRKMIKQGKAKPSTSCLKRKHKQSSKIHGKRFEKDDLEKSHWSCTACTFMNLDIIPSCEMCLTPRIKRLRGAGSSDYAKDIRNDNDKTEHMVEVLNVSSDSKDIHFENTNLELNKKYKRVNDGKSKNDLDTTFSTLKNGLDETSESVLPSLCTDQVTLTSDGLTLADNVHTSGFAKSKCALRSVSTHSESQNAKREEELQRCNADLSGIEDDGITESESEHLFEACCSYLTNCDEEREKSFENDASELNIKEIDQTESFILENSSFEEFQSDATDCDDLKGEETLDEDVDNMSVCNWDDVEVHSLFQFGCSQHTSRVYVYDQNGTPLKVSFIPLDVEMKNYSELPRFLLHPRHLELLRRFVREWNRLSQTKRRLIARSRIVFTSPSVVYDQIKSGRISSKQRYSTKADVSATSTRNVAVNGGSLRIITKTNGVTRKIKLTDDLSSESSDVTNMLQGFVQALDQEGNPLCLNCQSPFNTSLISQTVLEKHSWQTRLCSQNCFQTFWMKHNRSYSVQQVYSLERGICQLCHFDAHKFFENIKATRNFEKRAKMIQESKYSALTTEYKERMVTQPTQGLFWNVDHIQPVSEGGGECDIDNLRTLCTVCHRDVTRQQNKDRPKQKLRQAAATCQNITTFFRPLN